MRIEQFDHLGEVGERPGQAVDLVDDHDIDETLADIGEQTLQRRPLHRAARKPAVVVCGLDELPAFAGLALDERLARLALGVQRVEVLLETLLRALAV